MLPSEQLSQLIKANGELEKSGIPEYVLTAGISPASRAARNEVVYAMRMQGKTFQEIADKFGISQSSAHRRMHAYEKQYKERMKDLNSDDLIVREVQRLDGLEDTLRRSLNGSCVVDDTAKIMSEIRRVIALRVKIMGDVGMINVVPKKLEAAVVIVPFDLDTNAMANPALRAKILQLDEEIAADKGNGE